MDEPSTVALRLPPADGGLCDLIGRRRSTRQFAPGTVGVDDIGRLLWSGYGRRSGGGRTVPSAHALYPLTVTVVAGEVGMAPPAVHQYDPDAHRLIRAAVGDHRGRVADTSLADSGWLASAPVLIVLQADVGRVNEHFAEQPPLGRRGERYVWLEAGHVSQNIYLAATECGLGAVLVAGFDDERLSGVMTEIGRGGTTNRPLAIVAIGLRS